MFFNSPQRILTRVSKLNVDQLPIKTGLPTLDRFLAQALLVEPFKIRDYRHDRNACLQTFACLQEVLDAPNLPLVWIVNDVILPWNESVSRKDDPRIETLNNLRVLLRFRGKDAPFGKVDPKWLPAVITAAVPEPRSLSVLHDFLKDQGEGNLPLPAQRALAVKIDQVMAKLRYANSWLSNSLENLENMAGRDPRGNALLSELFVIQDAFPAELEKLLDGMSDWTRISVMRKTAAESDVRQQSSRHDDADLLAPDQRAKLFLDRYRLKRRLDTEFWHHVDQFASWGFPFAPKRLLDNLFGYKFLRQQSLKKVEFTAKGAQELLRFAVADGVGSLDRVSFAKAVAAKLDPDEDLARQVEDFYLPQKNKTMLLAALRPSAAEKTDDTLARLSQSRKDLIDHFHDIPNLWFPLDETKVVQGPWGRRSLVDFGGQIAPYWESRYTYRPNATYRVDLSTYLDAVASAALLGDDVSELARELHQVFAKAQVHLESLRDGDVASQSPADLVPPKEGKISRESDFRKRIPLDLRRSTPLPNSVPREAMIAKEEDVLAAMKHCLDRIDRFVTPDPHTDWERANMPGNASKPSAKWLKTAREGLDPIALAARLRGIEPFHATISRYDRYKDRAPDSHWVEQQHQRASVWAAQLCNPDLVGGPLTELALRCYVTVQDLGIKAEKLGNATLTSLEALPDGAGAPFLARILSRVRYPKIRKKINASLDAAAAAAGITRGELDELTVPDHGMASGTACLPLGLGFADITLDGMKAKIAWRDDQGKGRKSPTKVMKDADPDGIKAAKALIKEIDKDVSTQVRRLERLYLQDRAWGFQDWRDRYLHHGTMAPLCRKLLWITQSGEVFLPVADAGEDIDGQTVDLTAARIQLWHPIMSNAQTIEKWREKLLKDEVLQPFRQVWRETYDLTAEDQSLETYSNRFAGHIVRQHQMMTLAHLNGWICTHRMWVDAPNNEPSHILLPEHDLYAEFWTTGAGGDDPPVLDSCAYIYLTTDRLRFHRIAQEAKYSRGDMIALSEVPPIVVSEIMRHCDLFTSVPSIAMDANWLDRGKEAEHPNQWQRQADAYWLSSFEADLSPVSTVRRAMLERLLADGALSSSYLLEGSYLHVRTAKDTYRIHIGTAGVQRLSDFEKVAVSGSTKGDGAENLPFVGEQALGLILSKAAKLRRIDGD